VSSSGLAQKRTFQAATFRTSKDEIDALYEERDRLLKRLDEDVDLAA
jgi:hypothetical protein